MRGFAEGYNATGDTNSAHDAAVMLVRFAYDYPAWVRYANLAAWAGGSSENAQP